ncbi:MAG TPA: hypothetical protein VFI22_17980, partial [Thermomicrobiales bacterium]|nr:hypothetical protein [Thermomicrobiales bacterium]
MSRRRGGNASRRGREGASPGETIRVRFTGGPIVNGIRFDDVARTCAQVSSRRRALGIAGGALGTIALGGAAAAKKGNKKKRHKHGFHFKGEGSITSPGADGCETDPDGCVVEFEGDGKEGHSGQFSFTGSLTVHWTEATENRHGDLCAPASGQTVLTAEGDKVGAITLSIEGTDCDLGGPSEVRHKVSGTYEITDADG